MTPSTSVDRDEPARIAALWTTLGKLLEDLAKATDQASFLDHCLDDLLASFGADRAVVLVHHEDGGVSCPAARTRGRAIKESEREAISRTVTRRAVATGACVVSRPLDDLDAGESMVLKGISLAMAAPVRATRWTGTHPAETVGVLYVDFRDASRTAGEPERAFLQAVAHVLGAVLVPYRKLEHAQKELREFSARETPRDPSLEELLAFPSMAAIRKELSSCLRGDSPILVLGESGTGKTQLARAIAAASDRTPIVRAVLGSSDDLNTITSELFGHERGSFSGALGKRTGLVEFADEGTLIFDEILNLPAPAQQLLLDFTQFGTYRPLGHDKREPKHARVRILSATNGDIPTAIAERRFREDLYYRLSSVVLELPPLRDRKSELPALVRSISARLSPGSRAVTLSPALEAWLVGPSASYPGNVRQLESAVRRARERAVADGVLDALDVVHFQPQALGAKTAVEIQPPRAPAPSGAELRGAWATLQRERERLDASERALLERALDDADGVVAHVARDLGVARTSLVSKLESANLGRKKRAR